MTCLQAGLIPVVSYESGIDVNDFGVILKDCSIDEIINSIKAVSKLPAEKLKRMSRKAWEFARANHTLENYAEEYLKVIEKIQNTCQGIHMKAFSFQVSEMKQDGVLLKWLRSCNCKHTLTGLLTV